MRILELCDFFSNYGSNFIPSLCGLEKELAKKGHETFFIFSKRNLSKKFYEWEKPFEAKHKTILLDFTNYSIVNNVVDFIKKNNIQIVHAHFIASFYLSEIRRKTDKNVKFYEHIHSAPYNNKKTIKAFVKRVRNVFLLKHNIPKIAVSDAIIPMTKYIYPGCKVISCKNAIDLRRLDKLPYSRKKEFNILFFGYNYYVKGCDLIVEAANNLSKDYDIHLDIVFGDNFEKNKKIILEKYNGIPKCVTILEPTNNISDYYKTHQVFVNASRSEGMSYANIEAYYSGCLTVFSNIQQNTTVGLPNVIYFESGDSKNLEKAILKAYKNRNFYENDCDFVEKNYSVESWAKRILTIFDI